MKHLLRIWILALVVSPTLVANEVAAEDSEKDETPPPVGLVHFTANNARVVDAVLPGRLQAVAPLPASLGHGLAVLIEPEDNAGERALYRIRDQKIELLADRLPEDIDRLHSPTSRDELWLGEIDRVWRWTEAGLKTIIERPGVDLGSLERGRLVSEDGVALPTIGRLTWLDSQLAPAASDIDLPIQAKRTATGLELLTWPLYRLTPGDKAVYVAGPQADGQTRLRTQLIDPTAAEEDRRAEAWSRLPAPENVEASWYLELDGLPTLVVATTQADKYGVFEKLKLRLFRLRADRTRAGRGSSFKMETVTRRWYQIEPRTMDLDGDGKQDLVVVQPEGLGAKKLFVQAFRGLGSGRFDSRKPRKTVIVAPSARWNMENDFDGDGNVDLAIGEGRRIAIHRGLGLHKKLVVEKEPTWNIPASAAGDVERVVSVSLGGESDIDVEDQPSARGRLRSMDLDGDGRVELVRASESVERAVVRIVWID